MDKDDFINLLRDQQYKYHLKNDTSEDGRITFHESEYSKIPDNLLNKFPVSFKCKSSTGDFLLIDAEIKVKDSNRVKVMFYTDWN